MSIAASQPMIYRKAIWKLSEQLTGIREGGGGGNYKAMDFSQAWENFVPQRMNNY